MYKKALLLAGLLSLAGSAQATVVEFGRDPGQSLGGTTGVNQVIAALDMPGYPITGSGWVTQWEAFNAGSKTATVASVILSPVPGSPGQYVITGMDYAELKPGQNLIPNPTYDDIAGGSNALEAGSIFGLLHTVNKGRVSGSQAAGVGLDTWVYSNWAAPGDLSGPLTFSSLPAPRTYSYLVTARIPEPASLWLVGLPLAWWSVSRRKLSNTAAA